MKILVVGSGAREHALCYKIAQSPKVTKLVCAPGNPGIALIPGIIVESAHTDRSICEMSWYEGFDLVVVGPDHLLEQSLTDCLKERKIGVFGPTRRAAKIEWSKLFAKTFMNRHGIKTAPWAAVATPREARRVAAAFSGLPVVLKADGLARGKGVFVVYSEQEMNDALAELFVKQTFGASAHMVIVEEKLSGLECSVTYIADGKRGIMLPDVMDYKQAYDGDRGANTGGMGAHSPSFVLSDAQLEYVRVHIMQKVIDGLRKEGREFRGALTANLMVTDADEIYVLEFNARFGDPECEVQMLLIAEDIVPLLWSAATGSLKERIIAVKDRVAASVVLVSDPYPQQPTVGEPILGMDAAMKCSTIFHAGTAMRDNRLVTSGGRVLNVCAADDTLIGALKRAYVGAQLLNWEHKRFRQDIGSRILKESLGTEKISV